METLWTELRRIVLTKTVVVTASLIPAVTLGVSILADPPTTFYPRFLVNETGNWGLRFLVLTLCISPLRRLTGWHEIIRVRRLLGLTAFAYSGVHVILWALLEWSLDWRAIGGRIVSDPFITIGTIGLALLVPLALTSNRRAITRLGHRWSRLHGLTYVAAIAALAHFWLKGPFAALNARKWILAVAMLFAIRLLTVWRRSGWFRFSAR